MIPSFLYPTQYDLATSDGCITDFKWINKNFAQATVVISQISPLFVGFEIDASNILFNSKSTIAQLGIDAIMTDFMLDRNNLTATISLNFQARGLIAEKMLTLLQVGAFVGKLFAADERRRVRDPDYIGRMFGRSDRWGKPLLSLGGLHGSNDLILDKVEGRTVAYLTLQDGCVKYDSFIEGLLPTIAKALVTKTKVRDILRLHQKWYPSIARHASENDILLVRTLPLHIRTVFAHVVDNLLPPGYHHTSASILQPDTFASGDIYEFYGQSNREITDIPLEFYALEPYREYVFFSDRDQLQSCLEDNKSLFTAFKTAPEPKDNQAATFIVKGKQLQELKPEDWIIKEQRLQEFPGAFHRARQALMIERYIEQQSSYIFLKSIDNGTITSQGVLLTRYFPSPLMKRMLLSDQVQRCLKGIYFQYPSSSNFNFFSAEDRALLHDLDKFAIPIYWVDETSQQILQYAQKPDRDSGLFIPKNSVDRFLKSTVFGIYGSNLLCGNFEEELRILFQGILAMREEMKHPLLSKNIPLSLVTGGGPGAMEVGNRIAKELNILSCANIVDFRLKNAAFVNEQLQNSFVEAKMTYRLDKLVERQAEFNLDFPIFLTGGIGTDFEYSLEEVRRKVGSVNTTPILLFGEINYWKEKVTSRFKCNLENGTIKGSEWISNCFYCIQTAEQGLKIYYDYFSNTLPIGPNGPVYTEGFASNYGI